MNTPITRQEDLDLKLKLKVLIIIAVNLHIFLVFFIVDAIVCLHAQIMFWPIQIGVSLSTAHVHTKEYLIALEVKYTYLVVWILKSRFTAV